MKTVVIHYCGGCNPRYDRVALAARLQREFPRFSYHYDLDAPADLAIVLSGCDVGCAARSRENAPNRVLINNDAQVKVLYAALERLADEAES